MSNIENGAAVYIQCCPVCGSYGAGVGVHNEEVVGNKLFVDCDCEYCDSQWTVEFDYVGMETALLDDTDENEEE